jgi:hypothetical protein
VALCLLIFFVNAEGQGDATLGRAVDLLCAPPLSQVYLSQADFDRDNASNGTEKVRKASAARSTPYGQPAGTCADSSTLSVNCSYICQAVPTQPAKARALEMHAVLAARVGSLATTRVDSARALVAKLRAAAAAAAAAVAAAAARVPKGRRRSRSRIRASGPRRHRIRLAAKDYARTALPPRDACILLRCPGPAMLLSRP